MKLKVEHAGVSSVVAGPSQQKQKKNLTPWDYREAPHIKNKVKLYKQQFHVFSGCKWRQHMAAALLL